MTPSATSLRRGSAVRRVLLGAAIAAVLLAPTACSDDEPPPPTGPARASTSPDALRSPLPCRTVEAILDMDPSDVEARFGSAHALPAEEILVPGTEAAVDALRSARRLRNRLAPGGHEVVRSWRQGDGLVVHIAFDPPVDLPPELGVASEDSGTAIIGPDGNATWDPDAGDDVFADVAAADFNVDADGGLINLVPSPEPVWCWMTFAPEGGMLLDR